MTRRSLSLKAYLALTGGPVVRGGSVPAPDGADVWMHAETTEAGRALARFAARLSAQRPDLRLAATGTVPASDDIAHWATPPERRGACDAFARALSPGVGLWCGAPLRPALLDSFHRQGTRLQLLDADGGPWHTPSPGWLPDLAPATLALFDMVHAVDESAARQLRRTGVETGRMRVSGPLHDAAPPQDVADADHDTLAARLAGRPVWLAAGLCADEAQSVMHAHRAALRMAHRLLLIAVPATEADAMALAAAAAAEGLRSCAWDAGETPDENTQVLLTEGPEMLALWYRLAPLTFLGGSLTPGHPGLDPYTPASLGSAILYGPQVGPHLAAYRALVEAGAARIVRDAESLSAAVSHLIAPDQAATMAHAGWSVVSAGAALVDGVIADITATLDTQKKDSP